MADFDFPPPRLCMGVVKNCAGVGGTSVPETCDCPRIAADTIASSQGSRASAMSAIEADQISAMTVLGYEKLASVLRRAYGQASRGKGNDRHASGEPFHEQPICAINRLHGSIDGALFQVAKKGHEARRLERDHAVAELLGAINYLAACVILVEEGILDSNTK